MPPFNAPYTPSQRRRRLPAVAVGAPAPSAPQAASAAGNGFMDKILPGADQWMQDNPGVLTQFASGMMSPAASNFASSLNNISIMQMKNGATSQRAKYLLDHGYASTPEEAHTLASDPALMAATFKDNTYADMVAERVKLAKVLGIDLNTDRGQQFAAAGTFPAEHNNVSDMTVPERLQTGTAMGLKGDKLQRYALTGQLTDPAAKGLKSSQFTQLTKDQNDLPVLETNLEKLKQARDLLDTGHVSSGTVPNLKTKLATMLGPDYGGDYVQDPAVTQDMQRFQKTMSSDAMIRMADELKGASSDKDVQNYLAIVADPNETLENRRNALDFAIKRLEAQVATRKKRMDYLTGIENGEDGSGDLGGSGGPPGGGGADGVVDFREYFKGP